MKGFMKGLGALTACLLLVCSLQFHASAAPIENCPGNCDHDAAIGTTHYKRLAEALNASADGDTVTVLKDITDADVMTIGGTITLDLGGKTLSGYVGPDEALLNAEKDLIVTNGTLSCGGNVCLTTRDCVLTIDKSVTVRSPITISGINSTATVNFNGTMINSTTFPAISGSSTSRANYIINIGETASITTEGSAVGMYGNGHLDIAGGTVTAKESLATIVIPDNHAMTFSITGGKFRINGDKFLDITLDDNTTAPEKFISGGTYNIDPTPWLADSYRSKDNGDGTYTVIPQQTLTFAPGGGSGTMASVKADRGTVTLPACSFTAPAGKHFKAWLIGGREYAAGATCTLSSDLTLTAVWADHSGGTATCLSRAYCAGCGAAYGSTGPHTLTYSGGTPATCTAAGMQSNARCSTCSQYFVNGSPVSASTLTIPALKHDMQQVKGKAATCTEEGLMEHEVCKTCGLIKAGGKELAEDQLTLPATGHKQQTVTAVASTCTTAGIAAHQRCSLCGEVSVNGKVVEEASLTLEMDSHVLSDWEQDAATHWKACVGCGEIFRQHSHTNSNGDEACDECGYPMAAAAEGETSGEDDGFSPAFLIPMIAAVVIAIGGVVIAIKKKKA